MSDASKSTETKQQARKHARTVRAVGESEEWLFTALQSIGDAVIATDGAGRIVFMNLVAVSLTGWSEEEAQGRDCREVFRIVNESTRVETESPVAKAIRDGVISGLANHTILIARDGAEHCIDDSGSPIRNKDGDLIGVVLIFRDVTERRNGERTRQEQQELLQTLFDHIPVIVAYLDQNELCKWVNREWTRVMGWSVAEMRRPEHRSMLGPSQPADQKETDISDAGTPSGWRDVRLAVKDGRILDISWASVRLSDGSCIRIGQDITLRKSAEALADKRQSLLETRNKRLEGSMRETDHRVRNDLQSVAALLDMQVMANDASVPVRELTRVRMHINTLAAIHDMLVSDVQAEGTVRLISTDAALNRLLPMLKVCVGEDRFRWSAEDVQLPIKQGLSLAVLINELVNNAVKHGGRNVDLRLATSHDTVTLVVSDDGPGFAEAFNPDRSANFGLEMVESIVRVDLGGKTSYKNQTSGGASVSVTFQLPTICEAAVR